MSQDHFLQAAACGTRVVRRRHPYHRRREDQVIPSASSRGGDWRTKQAEVLSPGVSLPGSFVTIPSTDLPLEPS